MRLPTAERALLLRICIIIGLIAVNTNGTVFYVDPQNGSIVNDGSSANPWSTLKEVFDSNKVESRMYETKPWEPDGNLIPKNAGAPVQPGDTLMLRSGFHGAIDAREYYNVDYITIMAQPGHTPKIASLELRSGCKWLVYGLTISPEFDSTYNKKTLINFASHSWTGPSYDCIAEACTAYSVDDASAWTKEQWDTLSCNAMSLPGNTLTARNNYFRNVNFGISVSGDSCLVEYNTIENFAGDGLRGLGDYCTFQYNLITNCYDVNENHDDGFQSWSVGDSGVGTGVVTGVVLRGNTIINYEDPNQPFLGTLQGIGCFDGMFAEWVVVNNVVITDHWHGITLSGATNCIIINNTVVDCNTEDPGPPWVRIGDHKDGTPSTGCVVRNNLSTAYNVSSQDVVQDHNITIDDYDTYFVNYTQRDLHLKAGCAAVDSGTADGAPPADINGISRPQGLGIDIGAYEYSDINPINTNIIQPAKLIRAYNYPNPFYTATLICFTAHTLAPYTVMIYNHHGQKVYSITGRVEMRGKQSVLWAGVDMHRKKVPAGLYLYRLKVDGCELGGDMLVLQ